MRAWDVAAVAGGIAAAVAVTVVLSRLLAAVASLDRTSRELLGAIDDVRRATPPPAIGAPAAGPGVSRSTGVAGNGRAALRPFDLGLASPVIKARAIGRGTSQAARQLRQRRER